MNQFTARLRNPRPGAPCLRGLWLTFLGPFGLEVAATGRVDWVGVDLQHGELEASDLAPLLRTTALPVLARVGSHDPVALARVLDTGVDGVIVAAVESAAQAEALVAAAVHPPRGRRSTGLSRASIRGVTAPPLLLPMVATAAGLQAAGEIAATDGVDGLFVGPYDLSLSLGEPSHLTEATIQAIDTTVRCARQHGRIVGAFAGSADLNSRLPHLDLLAVDTDVAALRAGLELLFGDIAAVGQRQAS